MDAPLVPANIQALLAKGPTDAAHVVELVAPMELASQGFLGGACW